VVSRSDTTGNEERRNSGTPAGVHIIIESPESGGHATGYLPPRRWRETAEFVLPDFCQDNASRFFEKCDRLFAAHAWKVVEEDVETVATLDVIHKRADRHPCAHKDGLAAMNVRVGVNDGVDVGHGLPAREDTTPLPGSQLSVADDLLICCLISRLDPEVDLCVNGG
jgi:hypothetical protein